ncbi:MAG TPA: hypothetical protein VFA04_02790 [Bryobacteraceae bacterium]|nr:hypothetical protein [Bryobacteraceae bacterium]
MNPRILVAFAAGAMAASGIVFIAMRPGSHSAAASLTPEAHSNPPKQARPLPLPTPPPDVDSAADLIQVQGHAANPAARRPLKPSPMPVAEKKWPADKPEPVLVAQSGAPEPPGSMPVERSEEPPPPSPAPAPDAAPAPVQPPETSAAPVPERMPNTVTLVPGMLISVRTDQPLSARRNQIGDTFAADLDQPLVIDGWIIAARRSRAEGRVVSAQDGRLGLQLTAINTTDGQHLAIRTSTFLKRATAWNGNDAASVGGAAVIGAAIGAMAGGGKGAGIGAIAGGAAGAGAVMYSRRAGTDIPVETRITFRVDQPLTITERLD